MSRHDAVVRRLEARFPGGIPREILFRAARARMRGQAITLEMADEWAAAVTDAAPAESPEPSYRTGYERPGPEFVYYARFGSMVKIGTTRNLDARMRAVPHDELLATEPGGRQQERSRHAQFRELRHHREWFRYESPLIEHIEALRGKA